jgi:serine/threonine-protein kinase
MGQPVPPTGPSVEDDALGRADASYVRHSAPDRRAAPEDTHPSTFIPAPARVPSEALSLSRRTASSLPPSDLILEPEREPTKAPSLPPRIARFAHFEVLGRIAVGGMAEIYLGRDSVEGGGLRQLAIKVLRRQTGAQDEAYFEELFLREGRTAAQLVHPNICHIYSFGKWRGHLYIAMEWIDGVSLAQVLRSLSDHGRTLDPLIAASIAAQVAGALDYAHHVRDARRRALAIVHRDVNPQNIMIRHDGMVKLLDFGVAQVADIETDSRTDTVKGKFAYMAPEQAQRKAIDGRADVFALGVCLYEMLTGKRLYKRGSLRETIEALMSEPPPSLRVSAPALPAELDEIVRLALAKDPNDRFASAADMQAALETFLARSGEVVSARRISSMMDTIYPEARLASPSLFTGPEIVERLAALEEEEAEPHGMAPSDTPIDLPMMRFGARAFAALAACVLLVVLLWSWMAREPAPSKPALLEARTHEPAPAPPLPAAAATEQAPPTIAPSAPVAPAGATETDPKSDRPKTVSVRRRRRAPDFVATPGF